MNINKTKIIIDSRVRLPFEYVKGSENERFALAEKLTDDLFQKIKDLYVIDETNLYTKKITAVSKKIIGKKIQEILPKSLNIRIKGLVDEFRNRPDTIGTTYFISHENDGAHHVKEVGIMMEVTEDKKINYDDVGTLMHEFRHVIDGILNPKMDVRALKVSKNGNPFKKILQKYIFDMHFNFLDRMIFDIKLNMKMRKLSEEMKIDALQEMRYVVKSEINAYSNDLKYQEEINRNLGVESDLGGELRLSDLHFDRKLKFINKKLYRTIKKARKNHTQTLHRT